MTEIAFHFNAPDKLAYACRLLRKAIAREVKVVVTASPELLLQLDTQLWTFSQLDFIAHVRLPAPPHMRAISPVVLAETLDDLPHRQLLVNLGDTVPAGFSEFERLIDVVSLDEADRLQARNRWKHYSQLGHAIVRHDLALKESA